MQVPPIAAEPQCLTENLCRRDRPLGRARRLERFSFKHWVSKQRIERNLARNQEHVLPSPPPYNPPSACCPPRPKIFRPRFTFAACTMPHKSRRNPAQVAEIQCYLSTEGSPASIPNSKVAPNKHPPPSLSILHLNYISQDK